MSTSLKTQTYGVLTINAAFLQEIKEACSPLWERVYQLRESALNGLPLSVDVNHWVSQLTDLRAQLVNAFSLEETYGYITSASRPLAGVPFDPSEVRAQHAELYMQLSELCEQVEEAQYRGTIVRDFSNYSVAFSSFADALQCHEQNEARLIEHGLGLTSRTP